MTQTQKLELRSIKRLFDQHGVGAVVSRHHVVAQGADGSAVQVCTMEKAQHIIRAMAK